MSIILSNIILYILSNILFNLCILSKEIDDRVANIRYSHSWRHNVAGAVVNWQFPTRT